jgi:hypothetical protein
MQTFADLGSTQLHRQPTVQVLFWCSCPGTKNISYRRCSSHHIHRSHPLGSGAQSPMMYLQRCGCCSISLILTGANGKRRSDNDQRSSACFAALKSRASPSSNSTERQTWNSAADSYPPSYPQQATLSASVIKSYLELVLASGCKTYRHYPNKRSYRRQTLRSGRL